MSLFNTQYLNPDSLYNVWFEIDEPIFIIFHNQQSTLVKDFQRAVTEAVDESPRLKKCKVLQMDCSEDLESLPEDYKIFRLPCLILYDAEEKGRINQIVSVKDLRDWMENA